MAKPEFTVDDKRFTDMGFQRFLVDSVSTYLPLSKGCCGWDKGKPIEVSKRIVLGYHSNDAVVDGQYDEFGDQPGGENILIRVPADPESPDRALMEAEIVPHRYLGLRTSPEHFSGLLQQSTVKSFRLSENQDKERDQADQCFVWEIQDLQTMYTPVFLSGTGSGAKQSETQEPPLSGQEAGALLTELESETQKKIHDLMSGFVQSLVASLPTESNAKELLTEKVVADIFTRSLDKTPDSEMAKAFEQIQQEGMEQRQAITSRISSVPQIEIRVFFFIIDIVLTQQTRSSDESLVQKAWKRNRAEACSHIGDGDGVELGMEPSDPVLVKAIAEKNAAQDPDLSTEICFQHSPTQIGRNVRQYCVSRAMKSDEIEPDLERDITPVYLTQDTLVVTPLDPKAAPVDLLTFKITSAAGSVIEKGRIRWSDLDLEYENSFQQSRTIPESEEVQEEKEEKQEEKEEEEPTPETDASIRRKKALSKLDVIGSMVHRIDLSCDTDESDHSSKRRMEVSGRQEFREEGRLVDTDHLDCRYSAIPTSILFPLQIMEIKDRICDPSTAFAAAYREAAGGPNQERDPEAVLGTKVDDTQRVQLMLIDLHFLVVTVAAQNNRLARTLYSVNP